MIVTGHYVCYDPFHMQGIDAQTLGKKAKTSPNKIGMLYSGAATCLLIFVQHVFYASWLAGTYFVKSSQVSARVICTRLHILSLRLRRLRS
jgi:hypothetical protein